MKASILEKLDRLKERYEEVSAMLSEADVINNQNVGQQGENSVGH